MNELEAALGHASAILLDFDGPVCGVFSNLPAPVVAAQVRVALELPTEQHDDWPVTNDPLFLLASAWRVSPDAALRADTTLRELELQAVAGASPTPGAELLLRAAAERQIPVFIVSNNSEGAISTYLGHHGLTHLIASIFGRPVGRPDLMKPNPHLLELALAQRRSGRSRAVMIGDSVSDGEAANAASVTFIGFANRPGKQERLRHAGAAWVASHMGDIAAALATST